MNLFSNGAGKFVLEYEDSELFVFLSTTAASVIEACKTYPTNGQKPSRGIAKTMQKALECGPVIFANFLTEQADLLYNAVARFVVEGKPIYMRKAMPLLITEALTEFENWKQNFKNDGHIVITNRISSSFMFPRNRTEYNEKFLALIQE